VCSLSEVFTLRCFHVVSCLPDSLLSWFFSHLSPLKCLVLYDATLYPVFCPPSQTSGKTFVKVLWDTSNIQIGKDRKVEKRWVFLFQSSLGCLLLHCNATRKISSPHNAVFYFFKIDMNKLQLTSAFCPASTSC